uniref:F-box domain-containing protein n=1 Tax=Caenorhabditis tropicalis TaxID=1561998 RepID=A0A1I7UTJ2_9PELO
MDLLRLPLVVLIDIFKNMDFREKFLISFLSKRARNTLKLTCVVPHFVINLSDKLCIDTGSRDNPSKVTEDHLIGGEVMRLSLYPGQIILRENSPQKQLSFAGYLLDTFLKSTISIGFDDPTLSATVLEFMKIINQRKLSIETFNYSLTEDSSEFIPRILDECSEVTDSIDIHAISPNFMYTPPRPFKAEILCVWKTTNWLNLEDFMSCHRVVVELGKNSNRTAETYNSFFASWMNSDARLQELTFHSIEKQEYRTIMSAVSNQGTLQRLGKEWIEVKRRNGLEFFIYTFRVYMIIYTKQAYLEEMRKQEALFGNHTINQNP